MLRVQRQPSGLLITVLMNPDVDTRTAEESRRLPDVEAATAAVHEFLERFAEEAGR
ncbi:hypothetical protein ACPPVO_32070 [Dactylosporangium sp. McL0621]|uniref:hypothetical protein n=1 Tax=Dactylosporangium sp. McL0621 TaxID=3415678 RepID=UPI003CF1CC6E